MRALVSSVQPKLVGTLAVFTHVTIGAFGADKTLQEIVLRSGISLTQPDLIGANSVNPVLWINIDTGINGQSIRTVDWK